MSLPCLNQALIPQKGRMGFNQLLIKAEKEDSQSTISIDRDNIFLDDNNRLSSVTLIEFVNQLRASVLGYNTGCHQGENNIGLFVGLQDAEFLKPVFVGDELSLRGFVTEEVYQVSFFQGTILKAGKEIAHLVTKLYELKDAAEFETIIAAQKRVTEESDTKSNLFKPPVYLSSHMQRSLYSYIKEKTVGEDCISFTIACPEDFDAFDGHFLGNPILPGVILLEIGKLGVELLLERTISLGGIKRMKISSIILPNQVVSCNIKIGKSGEAITSFSAVFKGESYAEISRFTGYFC
jgi:3-hydroxymyristoyl/3-hydroxydecanoyl-(acyl carrier protein) dehydratase